MDRFEILVKPTDPFSERFIDKHKVQKVRFFKLTNIFGV